MPKFNLNDDLEAHNLPTGNFGFSATKINGLASSEYTIVTIAIDESGSVGSFKNEIENAVKEIVKSCRYSKRADSLMLRIVAFGSSMREVHGFKLLSECNVDDYTGIVQDGGMTALYDAAKNSIDATSLYGKTLIENSYNVNGIVFVISDGDNNSGVYTKNSVKDSLANAVKTETLESLVSILIGVNVQSPQLSKYLNDMHTDCGFTQYVELQNASSSTLARLAQFVSKSISSQSNSLGSGTASKSLTF